MKELLHLVWQDMELSKLQDRDRKVKSLLNFFGGRFVLEKLGFPDCGEQTTFMNVVL